MAAERERESAAVLLERGEALLTCTGASGALRRSSQLTFARGVRRGGGDSEATSVACESTLLAVLDARRRRRPSGAGARQKGALLDSPAVTGEESEKLLSFGNDDGEEEAMAA